MKRRRGKGRAIVFWLKKHTQKKNIIKKGHNVLHDTTWDFDILHTIRKCQDIVCMCVHGCGYFHCGYDILGFAKVSILHNSEATFVCP